MMKIKHVNFDYSYKCDINFREKKDIVDSLRDPEHNYISFFVCRNPVAKLVCQDINILGVAYIIEIL